MDKASDERAMRESSFGLISRPDISLRRAVSRFLSGVGLVGLSASTIALALLPPQNAQPNFRWVVTWTFFGTLSRFGHVTVTSPASSDETMTFHSLRDCLSLIA